jgi:hypothetical protein
LCDRSAFEYVMQLHDAVIIPVTAGDQPLAICPFVFRQVCAVTPPTCLAVKEVADIRWVPLSFFQHPHHALQSWHRVGLPGRLRIPQMLVSYPGVVLPAPPCRAVDDGPTTLPFMSTYPHTAVVVANHNNPARCVLWGLTLGLTAAFLTRLGDPCLTHFLHTPQNVRARNVFLTLVQLKLDLTSWAVFAENWLSVSSIASKANPPTSQSASTTPARNTRLVATSKL